MLFHFIIKGLSATTDGLGRESADRFASRNNTNGIPCNSVFRGAGEYALRYRVAGALPKQPQQICSGMALTGLFAQICRRT